MHQYSLRVYYEDTDAGGVVYYANYLKFAERARTEMLRELGFTQQVLHAEYGILFVVKHCAAEYHAPARLDDALYVDTHLQEIGNSRIDFHQRVKRHSDNAALATLQVTVVCVNEAIRPTRIPAEIAKQFQIYTKKKMK